MLILSTFCFFFFNDTATTEIYTLSLHDALPISSNPRWCLCIASYQAPWVTTHRRSSCVKPHDWFCLFFLLRGLRAPRSEEHTSELQSRLHLVCRLLLEKKKKKQHNPTLIQEYMY